MDSVEAVVVAAIVLSLLYLVFRCYSTVIYRFYRPTCPACVNSQGEWNKFKSNCMLKLIRPVDINREDGSEHSLKLAHKFKVETVPTVIKLDNEGGHSVYDGPRTADAYMVWAKTN